MNQIETRNTNIEKFNQQRYSHRLINSISSSDDSLTIGSVDQTRQHWWDIHCPFVSDILKSMCRSQHDKERANLIRLQSCKTVDCFCFTCPRCDMLLENSRLCDQATLGESLEFITKFEIGKDTFLSSKY
eukprot:NODE_9_length_47730_cov_0.323718.p28 type:complete len:130 gc:universal NODE_9_length_47730_cov_0.323718:45532-45143(-)